MERNSETKTLSFSKGMTNVPSDLLSGDDELQESVGFIYKDGEMKPIQKAVKIGSIPYKIMYVHKLADYENIIAYDGSDKIYCYSVSDNTFTLIGEYSIGEINDIKSVGNTLICSTNKDLHYLLFKAGKYNDLGTSLPKPKVEFYTYAENLRSGGTACNLKEIVNMSFRTAACYDKNGELLFSDLESSEYSEYYTAYNISDDVDKAKAFQTAVQGHVAQKIELLKEKNLFCFPFFVRYALKLYDGSYARISSPILILPTINRNFYMFPATYNSGKKVYEEVRSSREETYDFFYRPFYSPLYYTAHIENIKGWEDIVKEIVVFATDDVMPFDLNEDFVFKRATEVNNECYANQVSRAGTSYNIDGEALTTDYNYYFEFNFYKQRAHDYIMPKKYKTDKEIIEELETKTQFYKLFSVDVDGDEVKIGHKTEAPIKKNVVANLTEQELLEVDDYYGWTDISAENIFVYNKRINILGEKRKPFSGFYDFMPIVDVYMDTSDMGDYDIYTHITSDTMDTWVKAQGEYQALPEMLNGWFYYPDPNATEMRIVLKDTQTGITVKLKRHPLLNGAYSFKALPFPRISKDEYTFSTMEVPSVDENATESFDSKILTSELNNPFVFNASGDNTVGTGKIIGIVANTDAVSQGQFGQYPLMVFTTEGIYGLSVNSEGLYSASYPISREVCNDDSPLVPTDKLVFFVSKKGLMAASGGQVVCMSEQMRGRVPLNFTNLGDGKFLEFLKGSLIAYDYRDSLLRIFSEGKTYQYIYNMVDKTFSMVNNGIEAQAVVNDYPDNLIQDTKGNVYSLTKKPDINDDTDVYDGTIITRPLKLGGSLNLKSLRKIKHLVNSTQGKVEFEIWASNNARNWCKLPSLLGKPWSYFVFKYKLSNFKASDSFTGTIVRIQNRREIHF